MKIAHLTSGHSPTDTRIFIKECQSLAKAGFDVTLVHPGDTYQSSSADVRFKGTGYRPAGRWDRILNVPKHVFRTACEVDADIYHFHDPALIPYALKLKRRGKIVIYDAHEDVPRQTLSKDYLLKPLRPLIAWALGVYEDYAAKKFDAIVAATPSIESRFKKLGLKTRTVTNYPKLEEFSVDSASATEKRTNTICYVGGLTEIRGFSPMMKALPLVKEAKLILAGPRLSAAQKASLGADFDWSQITELGEIGRNEVASLLRSAHLGLVLFQPEPNHIESLPIKLFEYMASGLPVVASNFPLWKEILEKNDCGICVDPTSPQEIASAIRTLLGSPKKAEEMGARGKKLVESMLNWSFQEKILIDLYRDFTRKN